MTATVKLQAKGQLTIPSQFRDAAGLVEGTVMEASYKDGRIVLTPKKLVDAGETTFTPEEAKKIRRGFRQLKAGKSTDWRDVKKDVLGR